MFETYEEMTAAVEKISQEAADYLRSAEVRALENFDEFPDLSVCFVWGDAPQGHEFWMGINCALEATTSAYFAPEGVEDLVDEEFLEDEAKVLAHLDLIQKVSEIDHSAAMYLRERMAAGLHIAAVLGCCITWDDSPQGFDYWCRINRSLGS